MRFSLKRKITLLIVITITLVSVLALVLFDNSLKRVEVSEYTRQSVDLAQTVAIVVDTDRVESVRNQVSSIYTNLDDKVSSDEWGTAGFESYLANYAAIEHSEDFLYLRDQIRSIQDVNHVDSLYLMYVDEDTKAVVYLVDAAYEDVCRPGTFDILEGEDLQIITNPERGFDPSISNTEEYGWNIATAKPIYDHAGNVLGYACVDISMNDIVNARYDTLAHIALILLILMAVVIVGGILFANHVLVRPINALSQASLRYHREGGPAHDHLFGDLGIHTHDEIGILADSMAKMEDDISGYAEELRRMAHNDSLTHVRNKRAYDIEMEQANEELAAGNTSIGLAVVDLNNLKSINDTYGHEKGDITIKLLCSLICHVFAHSPVFRIGGDEFAIVLRGHDLEHVNELVGQVNAQMEAVRQDAHLEPWEKESAAIGYALYDPALDQDLESVFSRADGAMYKRKQEMKRNLADPAS